MNHYRHIVKLCYRYVLHNVVHNKEVVTADKLDNKNHEKEEY